MEPFLAVDFADSVGRLGIVYGTKGKEGTPEKFSAILTHVSEQCNKLGLKATSYRIVDVLRRVELGNATPKEFPDLAAGILEFIRCELRSKQFYQMTAEEVEFLDTVPSFGPDVATHFPSVLDEIDEAGKCFAFGRSTACVFHLMRAMEVAMKAVYNTLNLPPPKLSDSWGLMLKPMDDELAKKPSLRTGGWAAHVQFFDEITADLRATKRAYRDTTMHVEKSYNPEQAKKVFAAVKGFFEHVATKLDQDGNLH